MKAIGQKHFDRDRSYRPERNKSIALKITEHLKDVRGIEVPKTFSEQLLTAHFESYNSLFNIPLHTIDAIVDACELFEEYVANIHQLVCTEVLSMARTHICVISAYTLAKALVPLKKDLPLNFRVTIKKDGSTIVIDEHS